MRSCWNIKSRPHPDTGCTRNATHGDFCSLHFKNPRRFAKPVDLMLLRPKQVDRLRRFLNRCRIKMGLIRCGRQGFAASLTTLANNATELISMEDVSSIPVHFRFSFPESTHMWLFDIRSLVQERQRLTEAGKAFKNPYTSKPLSPETLESIQKHVHWLHSRRYILTADTIEHVSYEQKVVELCFLIDSHGYLTNIRWFLTMSLPSIHRFTETINDLWTESLGLTDQERLAIYPEWPTNTTYLIVPYQTMNLTKAMDHLITALITFLKAGTVRESRGLAAVYIITALTTVSPGARRAFPFLQEMTV